MSKRIACIGGATLDRKVLPLGKLRIGTSNPVKTETCSGGTARNVAEALARLGCPVSLFSRVGTDAAGDRVLDELVGLPIDLDGVDRIGTAPTAGYTALLDPSGELVYGLADMEILDALDERWLEPIIESLARHDLWILDANLPRALLERLVAGTPRGVRLYADPVSVEKSRRLEPVLERVDTLFPDRAEAAALAGMELASGPDELATTLSEGGCRQVVITLGGDGVWITDPPRHERVPAMETSKVVNVSGAGDCFLAGFVFADMVGGALDPVRCGLAAAAFAVESRRTVPSDLTAERLLERCRSGP